MLEKAEIGKHSDVPVFRFTVYIAELICVHLSMKTCFLKKKILSMIRVFSRVNGEQYQLDTSSHLSMFHKSDVIKSMKHNTIV